MAYPSVDYTHPDTPALGVLATILTNRLHSEVREKGGAYGVNAYVDNESKTFNFSSLETQIFKKHLTLFKINMVIEIMTKII